WTGKRCGSFHGFDPSTHMLNRVTRNSGLFNPRRETVNCRAVGKIWFIRQEKTRYISSGSVYRLSSRIKSTLMASRARQLRVEVSKKSTAGVIGLPRYRVFRGDPSNQGANAPV